MNPGAAVLFASALAACAAAALAGPDPAAPVSLRLLVKLSHPMAEPTPDEQAEIVRQATRAAGLPVAYGAAVSAEWLALQLACAPADCDAAVQRLRDATTGLFVRVERDERRRRHGP